MTEALTDKRDAQLDAPERIDWRKLLNPNGKPVPATNDSAEPQPSEPLPPAKRPPQQAEYEALVEESALGYYDEDELQKRFTVPEPVFHEIKEHPGFQRDTLVKRKEQDSTDDAARLLARRETRHSLSTIREILDDPETTATERIKAIEQLRHIAGLGAKNESVNGSTNVPLQIITNLGISEAALESSGTYVAHAEAVDDAEIVEDSGGEVSENSFLDLLR